MKYSCARLLVLTSASLALGGCSAWFGKHSVARPPAMQEQPSQARLLLDSANEHLTSGRNALAIEAFQAAFANGENSAQAFNGMAVAFARIGRFDLAARYFERAIALAPTDPRYQDNLVRLMRSPRFAQQRNRAQLAQLERQQAAGQPAQQAAAAPLAGAVGRIVRVDKGQVFIAAAAPQASPRQVRVLALAEPAVTGKPDRRTEFDAAFAPPQAPAASAVEQPRVIRIPAGAADRAAAPQP